MWLPGFASNNSFIRARPKLSHSINARSQALSDGMPITVSRTTSRIVSVSVVALCRISGALQLCGNRTLSAILANTDSLNSLAQVAKLFAYFFITFSEF